MRIMHYLKYIYVVFFIGQAANANQVQELTLEEKVLNSDIVFIGETSKLYFGNIGDYDKASIAVIEVVDIFKGKRSLHKIDFLYSGPISEFDPVCCKKGDKYLFFVDTIDDKIFRSVNGPFGVYLINDDRVIGWSAKGEKIDIPLERIVREIKKIIGTP